MALARIVHVAPKPQQKAFNALYNGEFFIHKETLYIKLRTASAMQGGGGCAMHLANGQEVSFYSVDTVTPVKPTISYSYE